MPRTKQFEYGAALEKAVHLFWKQGYCHTSIEEVVNHMQLSRSSIYESFGDKKTLFLQALKKYHDENVAQVIAIFQVRPGEKVIDCLKTFYTNLVNDCFSGNDTGIRGCFIINVAVELASTDPTVALIVNVTREEVESAISKLIQHGQATGEIALMHDAARIASFLFSQIAGLRVLAKTNTPQQIYTHILDTIHYFLDTLQSKK